MKRLSWILAILFVGAVGFAFARNVTNTRVLGTVPESVEVEGWRDVDQSNWNELLAKYVDNDGLVNYRDWYLNDEDRKQLADYLEQLSIVDMDSQRTRQDKLAFWINAYNALTIHAMLDVYPTESIRHHTNPIGFNIWHHVKLMVGGTAHSLHDIEHDILRELNEPRIHFAIVCASMSCPRLLNEAYMPDRVFDQLGLNTEHFFSQRENFRIEGNDRVHLNSIFNFYKRDFGRTKQQRRETIASYLSDSRAKSIMLDPDAKITFIPFDWTINEQK